MTDNHDIAVIIMAKPPEAGEAKTRLAATLGDRRAIRIYDDLLENALSSVERANAARRFVYTYGDDFTATLTARGFDALADMGQYSLADKVEHAFTEAFRHVQYALMTITDDVFLTHYTLNKASAAVLAGKVVAGPTIDGGLYLIGISAAQVAIAKSLPFGRDNLCNALIKRAVSKNLPTELLETHVDIDSEEHLKKARELKNTLHTLSDLLDADPADAV